MKHQIYRNSGIYTFIWASIIFILCATPGQYIPSASWLDLLSVDKFVHAGIFYTLSTLFLVTAIKHNQSKATILLYILICVAYGVSLEWMQATFFINRSADWQDIIANSVGCLMALFFYSNLKKWVFVASKT